MFLTYLFLLVTAVDAIISRSLCKTSSMPVVTLFWDEETALYAVNTTHNNNRLLRGYGDFAIQEVDLDTTDSQQAIRVGRSIESTADSAQTSGTPPTIQARRCTCSRSHHMQSQDVDMDYYCPVRFEYCWRHRSVDEGPPSCLNETRQRNVTKTVWPICVVWLSILAIFLVTTTVGRNAVDCVLSHVVFPCCWNEIVYRIMLHRNPARVDFMLRRFYRRHEEQFEERWRERAATANSSSQEERPTQLHLKTKLYDSSVDQDVTACSADDDNDDWIDDGHNKMCSICFGIVQNGERVGVLSCHHLFHVDCLKRWLVRRNVCPLCLRNNAAKPVMSSINATVTTATEESSSSIGEDTVQQSDEPAHDRTSRPRDDPETGDE